MKPSVKEASKNRLQVFLSHSGFCSRRKVMELIFAGHVSVNGRVIREPSTPVDPKQDKVSVNGKEIREEKLVYILLNKPKGVIATVKDEHAPQTVLDLLPKEFQHLYPVGRLDKDTEGLLLLTNDGDAAYRLTHPKFNVSKIYLVIVRGRLKDEDRKLLEKGITLEGELTLRRRPNSKMEGAAQCSNLKQAFRFSSRRAEGLTAPAKITNIKLSESKTEFLMSIHEGKKRQIRLMLGSLKYPVLFLKRLQTGPLSLGKLPTGNWRFLTPEEITAITQISHAQDKKK